uniref:Uncharacterized protein n=1 Tax=Anguilla anguilla TaxID=7936 RepID=A0A0E9PZF1_ANGAN
MKINIHFAMHLFLHGKQYNDHISPIPMKLSQRKATSYWIIFTLH